MNCPKCGKELKPGVKFCGGCGTKIDAPAAGIKCPKCGKELKPGVKFCGGCGTKLEAAPSAPVAPVAAAPAGSPSEPRPDVSLIDKYIRWNIQPGQVAIKIDEADIAGYGRVEKIKGVHIQDGVKALLFVKGKFVAELPSGSYKFSDYVDQKTVRVPPPPPPKPSEDATKVAEEKKGWLSRAWGSTVRFVSSLFGGDQRRRERAAAAGITATVTADVPRVSMVLIRSAEFPMVFNAADVVTNPLRVNVGIHLLCKITNLNEFYTRMMADRKYISYESLATAFTSNVDAQVRQALSRVDSEHVAEASGALLEPLQRVISGSHPFITVQSILQFTTDSKELDGLRRLAEELYVSEKELDQVMLRNDFLNRYQAVRNEQELTELRASNAFELERGGVTSDHELAMARQNSGHEQAMTRQNSGHELEMARLNNAHTLDMNAVDHDFNLQRTRQDNAFEIQSGKDDNAFEAAKLEIYKEMNLTQDEQAKFDLMLSAERRLREAKSRDEVAAAMQEFEKSGMFREREMDELRRQMEHEDELKEMQREHAVSILSLQNAHAIEEQKLDWEILIGNKKLDEEFARRRKVESFNDEERDREMIRQRKEDAFNHERQDVAEARADARRDKEDAYADARREKEDAYADARRDKEEAHDDARRQADAAFSDSRRQADAAFADSRRQADAAFQDSRRQADIDFEKQERDQQMEMLRQAQAIRMEREAAEHRRSMEAAEAAHKQQLEADNAARAQEALLQRQRLEAQVENQRIYAGMSFEQIMAANPNISEAAAQALAKKFEAEAATAQAAAAAAQADKTAQMATEQKNEMKDFMQQMMSQQMQMNMQQMQMMRDTSVANASAFAGMQQTMMGAKQAELDRARADAAANNAMMLDGMKTTVGAMSGIVGAAAANAAPVPPAPSAPVAPAAPAPQAKAMPPAALKCPNCGAELEPGSSFCGECGTSI